MTARPAIRAFLSYQYRERECAESIAKSVSSTNDDLDYYDQRMRFQVESSEAASLKAALAAKLDKSDVLICVVGPTTATSSWVSWEIEYAAAHGKGLVAVQTDPGSPLPTGLTEGRATMVGPDVDEILRALEGPTRT